MRVSRYEQENEARGDGGQRRAGDDYAVDIEAAQGGVQQPFPAFFAQRRTLRGVRLAFALAARQLAAADAENPRYRRYERELRRGRASFP